MKELIGMRVFTTGDARNLDVGQGLLGTIIEQEPPYYETVAFLVVLDNYKGSKYSWWYDSDCLTFVLDESGDMTAEHPLPKDPKERIKLHGAKP
jgi:hypothetical protein